MAQSFCMYATARRTVTPVAGEPTTVVASLIELPAGAYVVVGKATVWTIDKNQGQAEFRLRAHPTNPALPVSVGSTGSDARRRRSRRGPVNAAGMEQDA
jgi:hypothetical protein